MNLQKAIFRSRSFIGSSIIHCTLEDENGERQVGKVEFKDDDEMFSALERSGLSTSALGGNRSVPVTREQLKSLGVKFR